MGRTVISPHNRHTWRAEVRRALAPAPTKLVCLVLSDYFDAENVEAGAYPSVERLCNETNLSNRTVATHLEHAKRIGLLRIDRRTRGGRGNRYIPLFPSQVQELHLGPKPSEEGSRGHPTEVHVTREPSSCGHVKEVHGNKPSNKPINKSPLRPSGGDWHHDAQRAFEAYNATAQRCALPQATKLTPDRERKIIARLKEYGLDGWHRALANLGKSAFLTGRTDQGFRADLEFVCQAKSFGRLHDGGYGNGRHRAAPVGSINGISRWGTG